MRNFPVVLDLTDTKCLNLKLSLHVRWIFVGLSLTLMWSTPCRCQANVGGPCPDATYSTIPNANCYFGVCVCLPNFYPNDESHACQPSVKLGSKCDPTSREINQCIANAYCSGDDVCVCNVGFYEKDNICTARLTIGDLCDPTNKNEQQCEANSRCQNDGGQSKCVLDSTLECSGRSTTDTQWLIIVGVLSTLVLILLILLIAVCVYFTKCREYPAHKDTMSGFPEDIIVSGSMPPTSTEKPETTYYTRKSNSFIDTLSITSNYLASDTNEMFSSRPPNATHDIHQKYLSKGANSFNDFQSISSNYSASNIWDSSPRPPNATHEVYRKLSRGEISKDEHSSSEFEISLANSTWASKRSFTPSETCLVEPVEKKKRKSRRKKRHKIRQLLLSPYRVPLTAPEMSFESRRPKTAKSAKSCSARLPFQTPRSNSTD